MRYWTSDTHFGHDNIVRFCDRPFSDTDHMNTDLIRRINDQVSPDDELWILGDACMGDLTKTLSMLTRIHAPVTLVAGNHDRCHPCHGRGKSERWSQEYLDRARLAALHLGSVDVELCDGTSVQVNHFPFAVEPHRMGRPDRFAQWRPVDDGRWLLHGHTHGAWRQRGQQIDVGIDAWGGYPVAEDTLLDHVRLVADLDALPWED